MRASGCEDSVWEGGRERKKAIPDEHCGAVHQVVGTVVPKDEELVQQPVPVNSEPDWNWDVWGLRS